MILVYIGNQVLAAFRYLPVYVCIWAYGYNITVYQLFISILLNEKSRTQAYKIYLVIL